ncbi:hypothetical protein LCGC14_1204400 [marine sediment metagenome]|uniref:Uncharacterized protein n=1 Tax=marine sediment metagenome TaxID=412755 RepID=A0A0F9PKQ4_9ZZZZ
MVNLYTSKETVAQLEWLIKDLNKKGHSVSMSGLVAKLINNYYKQRYNRVVESDGKITDSMIAEVKKRMIIKNQEKELIE